MSARRQLPIQRRDCLRRVLHSSAIFGSFSLGMSDRRAAGEDSLSLDSLYSPDSTDRAIESGIAYLLQSQRPSGAIADRGHELAMTSLAIMAMASIGVMPSSSSQRGRAIQRALDFCLENKHQDIRGYFDDRSGSRMYGHGITTLMLTEMLGMAVTPPQNKKLHDSLVNAIALILAAQAVPKPEKFQGGWRYSPSSRDSDLSVSVWQLMALRSAKNDGLAVPGEAIEQALAYLRYSYVSSRDRNGNLREKVSGFSYTPQSHHPTFTMTAAGLLAMQVCGQYDSPMVQGAADWLMEHPPKVNERFFHYGLYYYAQGMHQIGGKYAKEADRRVPEILLPAQRSDGSWQGQGGEEKNIGKVYSTALSILSLSVRYHYLPIYQR